MVAKQRMYCRFIHNGGVKYQHIASDAKQKTLDLPSPCF